MSEQSVQFLVSEIRDLRTRMDERFDAQDERIAELGASVAVLNNQMKTLLGNGQPGEIQKIQGRLSELEKQRNIWLGKHSVISATVSVLLSSVIATMKYWLPLLKK
jgi:hypothetical protein